MYRSKILSLITFLKFIFFLYFWDEIDIFEEYRLHKVKPFYILPQSSEIEILTS